MKVILTQDELENMVRDKLGLPYSSVLSVEVGASKDSTYVEREAFYSVLQHLSNGKYVNAIKVVRQAHGIGLKYAKQAIDDIRYLEEITLDHYTYAVKVAADSDRRYKETINVQES